MQQKGESSPKSASSKGGKGHGRHKGPGRPKTPSWKTRWKEYEKAQDKLHKATGKDKKNYHQTVVRKDLPNTTRTIEYQGGTELEVKTEKP